MTEPIAFDEIIIAPSTDSSASRFCGGTGALVVSGAMVTGRDQTGPAPHAHNRVGAIREQGERNTRSYRIPSTG